MFFRRVCRGVGKLVKSRLIYSKFSRIKALGPAKPQSSWREAAFSSHPATAQDAEPPSKLGCVSILVM